ncbi:MAG TPA: BtpA/SgcQ family protein [Thermomicrobiales bacterium]|nr:BtpA/SgcQ family protein [Thermomicrobiales bacterium]
MAGSEPRAGKLAIGMAQLRPLPGSWRYAGEPLASIVEAALAETAILAEAGFDGVQLQNMGDNPSSRRLGPETVAYMTAAALAIRRAFPALSLSILANWDAAAGIAVADAADAEFVRIEHTFTGVAVASWGLSQACCYEATRFHRKIGARCRILADVYEPHAVPLAPRPIADAARAAVEEGGAAGLFLTGRDFAESLTWLRAARAALPATPLFLGGGATAANVAEALTVADGVAVATWIKHGDMSNPVDPERARQFVAAVRQAARGDGAAAATATRRATTD